MKLNSYFSYICSEMRHNCLMFTRDKNLSYFYRMHNKNLLFISWIWSLISLLGYQRFAKKHVDLSFGGYETSLAVTWAFLMAIRDLRWPVLHFDALNGAATCQVVFLLAIICPIQPNVVKILWPRHPKASKILTVVSNFFVLAGASFVETLLTPVLPKLHL